MNKYSKETIKLAKKLYKKGLTLRAIMKETGIKSTSTVQFHCDPEYRKRMIESGRKWREANPDRWKQIYQKAAKKRKNNS